MPSKDSGLEDLLIVNTMSRIDAKLDKLDDRMDTMNATLLSQHASLEEHMKRSNLLEAKIDLETKLIREKLPENIQKELAAIDAAIRAQRTKQLTFGLKVAGAIAGLGGGGWGLKQVVQALAKVFGS